MEENLIESGLKEGQREYRDYSEKARHRVGCELWWEKMPCLVAGAGGILPRRHCASRDWRPWKTDQFRTSEV